MTDKTDVAKQSHFYFNFFFILFNNFEAVTFLNATKRFFQVS